MKNPNETSHLTMMGMWQVLEESQGMNRKAQQAFARELHKEFSAIDNAFGGEGKTALGAVDVARVAEQIQRD